MQINPFKCGNITPVCIELMNKLHVETILRKHSNGEDIDLVLELREFNTNLCKEVENATRESTKTESFRNDLGYPDLFALDRENL